MHYAYMLMYQNPASYDLGTLHQLENLLQSLCYIH